MDKRPLHHQKRPLHQDNEALHTPNSPRHRPIGGGAMQFGPFTLDPGRRRLTRGTRPIYVPDRQLDLLVCLTTHAGDIVPKDTLVDCAWRGVFVGDNSIVQAVKGLRKTLGPQPDGTPYIVTHLRQGYRFAAIVNVTAVDDGAERPVATAPRSEVDIPALLAPHRAFIDGRAALETLDEREIARAADAFARALEQDPNEPSAHIGRATAYLLRFESTRAERAPDVDALARAEYHARIGCGLDPESGDAWSTLALVLHRRHEPREALAAARKAVRLDRQEWRHHLRLAFVSGGAERLRAANRVLALCPGLGLAHWLAATVFIAREAFDPALEHLRRGCAAQDAQPAPGTSGARFTVVGLHHLHGLVLAALGRIDEAHAELEKELTFRESGHIFAREVTAHTLYALEALDVKRNQLEAGPGREQPSRVLGELPWSRETHHTDPMNDAIARAAVYTSAGRHADAARECANALALTEDPSAGWVLPVEPLLNVAAHRDAWAATLAALHQRFS